MPRDRTTVGLGLGLGLGVGVGPGRGLAIGRRPDDQMHCTPLGLTPKYLTVYNA